MDKVEKSLESAHHHSVRSQTLSIYSLIKFNSKLLWMHADMCSGLEENLYNIKSSCFHCFQ